MRLTLLTPKDFINLATEKNILVSGECYLEGGDILISGSAEAETTCKSGTFEAELNYSSVEDGEISIKASYTNYETDLSAVQILVIKDCVEPVISLASTYKKKRSFVINDVATDALSLTYSWTGSDKVVFNNPRQGNTSVLALTDGSHEFNLVVTDEAGNRSQASSTLIWDSTPPELSITKPSADTIFDATSVASVTIKGSCAENNQKISITGTLTSSTTCLKNLFSKVVDYSTSDDGTISINVSQVDDLGNEGTASVSIIKDTVAPSISLGSSSIIAEESVQIDASVIDTSSVTYLWTMQSGPGTLTFSDAAVLKPYVYANLNGVYVLRLTATDAVGLSSYADVSFTWNGWSKFSAADSFSCAIRYLGTLWCWGLNSKGQLGIGSMTSQYLPTQVNTDTDWANITLGGNTACAIKTGGSIWCWGDNSFKQVGDGTTTNRNMPTQIGTDTFWTQIYQGGSHGCALKNDGTIWCWGYNAAGNLGDGTLVDRASPVQAGSDANWVDISTGNSLTCGINNVGAIKCWGANYYGQVGNGNTTNKNIPTDIIVPSGITTWSSVFASDSTTCAIKTNGELWCWGGNYFGLLADGTTTQRPTQVRIGSDSDWSSVAVGSSHICALKTNKTRWCWGRNYSGVLGDGAYNNTTTPAQQGSESWEQLSSSYVHLLALKNDGSLWSWGSNNDGGFGNNTTDISLSLLQIGTASNWNMVATSLTLNCAIKSDHTLWCWGYNEKAQFGSGDQFNASNLQIGTDNDWAFVSIGWDHTCALKTTGTIWCWGTNAWGQLGDGTTTNHISPAQVGVASTWVQIAVGFGYTCGRKSDATLWCWGANFYGNLGDASATQRNTPVQIGIAEWTDIAVNLGMTSCGLKTDNSLWCWGNNSYNQIGDGTSTNQNIPTQVKNSDDSVTSDWAKIQVMYMHACGIKTNGTLYCWGKNSKGQLGDGTVTSRTKATQEITVATNWSSFSEAGMIGYFTCALKTDTTVWCFGDNSNGQLALGNRTDTSTPSLTNVSLNTQKVSVSFSHGSCIKNDGTLWSWGSKIPWLIVENLPVQVLNP